MPLKDQMFNYTEADFAYIYEHFISLESLCRWSGRSLAGAINRSTGGTLPHPAHTLRNGDYMVARNYFALADDAGTARNYGPHFIQRYIKAMNDRCLAIDDAQAQEELAAFLSGGYSKCLYEPSPETIAQKIWLMNTIALLVEHAQPANAGWCERLRLHVLALDRLELPFCDHDRRFFGGPVSRDRCITDVRTAYPQAFQAPALAAL